MRQTWTTDEGHTFDSEDEAKAYVGKQQEFLRYVIGFLLDEVKACSGYPKEAQTILESIGPERLARHILHLENFCSLVADIRNDKHYEELFFEFKSESENNEGPIWTGSWLEKKQCRVHPLTKLKLPE